jgi:hypothetical protein
MLVAQVSPEGGSDTGNKGSNEKRDASNYRDLGSHFPSCVGRLAA